MFCVRIRARPATAEASQEWAGAYANCYVAYPDSRGAEVLARWYVSDMGWMPESVLQMYAVDLDNVESEAEQYVREAQADGYCVVVHGWPADAEDAHADDAGEWDPPGEHERNLAEIAGTYTDVESGDRVLRLRTDRHFGWGPDESSYDGTWHVAGDELTLVYFPAPDSAKAVLDGPWRVLPDTLAGSGATLRREARTR